MQTVQRKFGKLMKRSADDSHVAILLKDFDEADKFLGKIIESTKAWREGWSSLLTHQGQMLAEFEALYAPIVGSSDTSTIHQPVPTPEATITRTTKLREEYEDLRKELLDELNSVEDRMIMPAMQAKDCLVPVKKTIKKREDRKLDYERYQSRVDSYTKKSKRSDRDTAALTKAESDLARATEEYNGADDHLRQNLPPLITAVFSLLPRLLATQIEIQNALLGHYYTVIYTFCEETQFSSTPVEMDQTVSEWEQIHLPIRQEIENFSCLANGKALSRLSSSPSNERQSSHSLLKSRITNGINSHRPLPPSSHPSSSGSSTSPISIQQRRTATSPSIPTPAYDTKPRPTDLSVSPSSSALAVPSSYLTPRTSSHSPSENHLLSPAATGLSTMAARTPANDYFSRNHQTQSQTGVNPGSAFDHGSIVAGKKKPPPPPKPRASSSNLAMFVTALYDFDGQSTGDLSFRTGDRIRVLKKTDSTEDWWEGELRGVEGSFPANYVE